MNFRRIPFQFTATDPQARRAELMKRFGVPTDDNMLVENPSYPILGSFSDATSCSPRLQHRIPVFHTSNNASRDCHEQTERGNNVDSPGRQPNVRVIPIHVETSPSDSKSSRQRTYSGSSAVPTQCSPRLSDKFSHSENHLPSKHEEQESVPLNVKNFTSSKPRVCNIPIIVEGKKDNVNKKDCTSTVSHGKKVVSDKPRVKKQVEGNGPCLSKTTVKSPKEQLPQKPPLSDVEISLKQISDVLDKLQPYKTGVDEFNGSYSDKQYRYLDEMLTQCMLKLDDVQTHGNEEVRKARKAAIKQVQDCLNALESKAQGNSGQKMDVTVENETVSNEAAEICAEQDKTTDVNVGQMEVDIDKNLCESENVSVSAETSTVENASNVEEVEMQDVSEQVTEVKKEEIDSVMDGEAEMRVELVLDNEIKEEKEDVLNSEIKDCKNEPSVNVDVEETKNKTISDIEIKEITDTTVEPTEVNNDNNVEYSIKVETGDKVVSVNDDTSNKEVSQSIIEIKEVEDSVPEVESCEKEVVSVSLKVEEPVPEDSAKSSVLITNSSQDLTKEVKTVGDHISTNEVSNTSHTDTLQTECCENAAADLKLLDSSDKLTDDKNVELMEVSEVSN